MKHYAKRLRQAERIRAKVQAVAPSREAKDARRDAYAEIKRALYAGERLTMPRALIARTLLEACFG